MACPFRASLLAVHVSVCGTPSTTVNVSLRVYVRACVRVSVCACVCGCGGGLSSPAEDVPDLPKDCGSQAWLAVLVQAWESEVALCGRQGTVPSSWTLWRVMWRLCRGGWGHFWSLREVTL